MTLPAATFLLDETRHLLALLPGFEMLDRRLSDEVAQLELVCTDADTAGCLLRICAAANVEITPSRVHVDDADGTWRHRFVLSARTTPIETIAQGNLQLLAIHLVWHLQRHGALSVEVADRRLREWHAAPVGA